MARINWRFIAAQIRRALLPIWFLVFAVPSTRWIIDGGYLGGDFRIYYRATKLWLSGGDPWSAGVNVFLPAHFGAPPASMFPLVPFTLLGEDQAAVVSVLVCALAAVYVVRRLHLPAYWLLFPPLVMGVICGNPSIPVLALLLAGSSWAAALAVSLKVYGIVPLMAERRWRAVIAALGLIIAMIAVAPGIWLEYGQRFGEISGRLSTESLGGYGALRLWPLVPPTLAALAIIARYDLRAAGWMIVPALWPGSEWHWTTFFMPVMTPWLAVLLAFDFRSLPAVLTWVYAAKILWLRHLASIGRSMSPRRESVTLPSPSLNTATYATPDVRAASVPTGSSIPERPTAPQ